MLEADKGAFFYSKLIFLHLQVQQALRVQQLEQMVQQLEQVLGQIQKEPRLPPQYVQLLVQN